MKRISAFLSGIAAIVMIALLAVAAAGSTQGTVVYRVQVSDLTPSLTAGPPDMTSHSYTVTETVSPGSNASFDTLFLAFASNTSNLTYTRSINSSLPLQPFLPAITNQSFTYSSNGTSVNAQISRNGTVTTTFQGQSYSLTSYTFSAQLWTPRPDLSSMNLTSIGQTPVSPLQSTPAAANENVTFSGSILAFQSGLVYSAKAVVQGTASLSITLLSTNLPLNAASASTATQVASIGISAGAIVGALALGVGVRRKKHGASAAEAKPDHWVD
jgi:hypothetical protein